MGDNVDQVSLQDNLKNFTESHLKTFRFVGSFQKKLPVESLNTTRDIVKIEPKDKDFIDKLIAVKKILVKQLIKDASENPIWIGITDPDSTGAPDGYNFWVVLPVEEFGIYWFQVDSVEFLDNEVRVKLEIVKPFKDEKCTADAMKAKANSSSSTINLEYVRNVSNSGGPSIGSIIGNSLQAVLYFLFTLLRELTDVLRVVTCYCFNYCFHKRH